MKRMGIRHSLIVLGLIAGAAQPLLAGNQHSIAQTADVPCSRHGGGTVLAVSPDGAHVYEGTFDESFGGMLFVSTRDSVTGALTVVQTIDGLEAAPTRMALSPDGAHVYLSVANTLRIYARDGGTGTLALVDVLPETAGSLAVSPDGAHVYVLTWPLRVYARDALTGLLTLVATQATSGTGIAVTPDGAHVYISRDTTPNASFLPTHAIDIYARDVVTGILTLTSTKAGTGYVPRSLVVSADGMNLYVAINDIPDRVEVYDRDASTGALTLIDTEAATDPGLSDLVDNFVMALSPDGAQLYVGSSEVHGGTIGSIDANVDRTALFLFSRSAVDGTLTLTTSYRDETGGVTDGLRGISAIAPSPDGAHVYTVGEGTVVFARNAIDGTLSFVSSSETEGRGQAVAVSPDDRHVYRLCDRAIAVLDRDAGDGTLTPVSVHSLGATVDHASTLAVSTDGRSVYVLEPENRLHDGFPTNGTLLVFGRDAGTGALSLITTYDEAASGFSWTDQMALSPDGLNLYLVATGTLLVYSRDPLTGLLTLLETQQDGGAVTGMEFASSVAISPGGEHVYVGTAGIVTFARDPVTGALTFQSYRPANGGGGGLLEPAAEVVVSPDGTSLYGFDTGPASISVFARDVATGELSFQSFVRGGTTSEPGSGFLNPVGLAVNSNGAYAYLAAFEILAAGEGRTPVFFGFRRDLETGALTQVQHLPGLVDMLNAYHSSEVWAFDASGRHVYIPKRRGDVVLLTRQDACGPAPQPGCEVAERSTLKAITKPGPKDVLSWKWKGAIPLTVGDPTTTTGFTLCLYDTSANPQPLVSNEVAAGGTCGNKPCWRAPVPGLKFKYANKAGVPDGVKALTLNAAAPGKIVLKGKGGGLPPLSLPYTSPVTAQLLGSNGECWEASFTVPRVSEATKYKATQ